jgi:integrase/recombinase XerD
MSISVKIILFTSKVLNSGEHPVMLRIIKDRKIKYIALAFHCKADEWDEKDGSFKKRHPNAAKRNLLLAKEKERALQIIDKFREDGVDFTMTEFEAAYRGISSEQAGKALNKKMTVYECFVEKIDRLRRSQKLGNAQVYEDTAKSFFQFTNDRELRFSSINVDMLERYEVWLRERGGIAGGISVKMRTLRAIYNDAIKKDIADANLYPFKKYDVGRLKSGGIKKALTRDEMRLIENVDLSANQNLRLARDLFVFSYYSRGMNFVDMMRLTWSDIQDGKITYVRAKTGHAFVLKVVPPVQAALDFYQSLQNKTRYVFPILLHDELTPKQIEDRKKKVLKRVNKQLKEIGDLLGIRKNLSTYVARHSFATNLKYAGVSVSVISETLGHSSAAVTETYLKQFEDTLLDDAVELLL